MEWVRILAYYYQAGTVGVPWIDGRFRGAALSFRTVRNRPFFFLRTFHSSRDVARLLMTGRISSSRGIFGENSRYQDVECDNSVARNSNSLGYWILTT